MSNTKMHPYNPAFKQTTNNDAATYATGIPIEHGESPLRHSDSTSPSSKVSPPISTIPNTTSPSLGLHHPHVIKGPRYVHVGSRKPVQLTHCPHCGKQHVNTHTRTKATGTTWAFFAGGLVIFWPLCWVPFVIDDCQQTNHYCTNCGAKVGRVKPFQ